MATKNTDPKHVDISLSQGMKISWTDGHESQYAIKYLRDNCPCATCRETKPAAVPANPFPMFKPPASMTGAEAVGRYAVQLNWSDGHNTGIYSFSHLREICPCGECKPGQQP
jgi:DUF971 family protein